MANFYKNFASETLMSFGKSFARLNGQPLDKSAIWYSLAEAEAYAATGSAYVGQPVAVIDEQNKKTTLYVVGANSTLEMVGAMPDGLSIDMHEGKLQLKGFADAENGTLPMIEGGTLVWKTLEDIGAGDGNDNTTYDIEALVKGEGDAAETYGIQVQAKFNGQNSGDPVVIPFDVYTKSEIDTKVESIEGRLDTLEAKEDKDTTYSVKEGDKVLALSGTEFSTEISLKHENGMISLTGIGGAVIAEFSDADFVKDSVLEDVNYNAETKEIEFTWKTVDGETKTDAVSVADFVQTYTAGNGLELSGNEFAVKVNAASESFLSVDADGLKLTGVQDAIDAAKNAALQDVANNYYNKTEVYNKEEVYNKDEVYAKSEVYTKGEADQAIADKISEVNGGESAGEVLGQLNAYKKTVNMEVWGDENGTGDENGNSRIDLLNAEVAALKQVGSQANVIEIVKVNGTALPITDKAVDVAVPTMLSQLDGYTGIDERITAAQNQANTGVENAGKAQTKANENADAILALQNRVTPLETAKGDHEARLIVLEDAKTAHDAEYAALHAIVGGHTTALAEKALQSDLDKVSAKATANETAIKTLNEITLPALTEEVGKKANATDVYTKTEIGAIAEGKTLVKMIEDAQAAATYDDSAIRTLISNETTRATEAEGLLSGRLDVVEDFFKAVETPDEVINTLAEIVAYIESDKSGAATMAANIKANTDAIALINDGTNGILAKANKYTDDAIAALPFATADKGGLVKSTDAINGVAVAADGTMSVNQISTSKLYVPADEEFVLNGGGAAGYGA